MLSLITDFIFNLGSTSERAFIYTTARLTYEIPYFPLFSLVSFAPSFFSNITWMNERMDEKRYISL